SAAGGFAWRLSTRMASVVDGPSAGMASRAALKARRASSQLRAGDAANPPGIAGPNSNLARVRAPLTPLIPHTPWGEVGPTTTNRSISRASIAAPAAATVASETKERLLYILFAASRRDAKFTVSPITV